MKNHENETFNEHIEELRSKNPRVTNFPLIHHLRDRLRLGKSIWYADRHIQEQLLKEMIRSGRFNAEGLFSKKVINRFANIYGFSPKKRSRIKNLPNTVPHNERYDENHEFDAIRIAELRKEIERKRYNEDRRNLPDGDRQLPSKKRSKIRKTYPQVSEYKADDLLMAS